MNSSVIETSRLTLCDSITKWFGQTFVDSCISWAKSTSWRAYRRVLQFYREQKFTKKEIGKFLNFYSCVKCGQESILSWNTEIVIKKIDRFLSNLISDDFPISNRDFKAFHSLIASGFRIFESLDGSIGTSRVPIWIFPKRKDLILYNST